MAAGIVASRDGGRTRHLAVQDHSQAHRQNGTATESKHFAKLRIEAHPTLRSAVARKSLQSRLAARRPAGYEGGLLNFRYGGASGRRRAAGE